MPVAAADERVAIRQTQRAEERIAERLRAVPAFALLAEKRHLVFPHDRAARIVLAHESDGFVREYDAKGAVVWEYEVPLFGKERKGGHGPEAFGNSLFSAMRLANGNTLIGAGNGHCVLEVTPAKEIVWKVEQNDLPGITLAWVTRVERLPNGNTLIGNCHAGPENPQFIEVTPEKKVVWTFKDFTNFGNSMPVQAALGAK